MYLFHPQILSVLCSFSLFPPICEKTHHKTICRLLVWRCSWSGALGWCKDYFSFKLWSVEGFYKLNRDSRLCLLFFFFFFFSFVKLQLHNIGTLLLLYTYSLLEVLGRCYFKRYQVLIFILCRTVFFYFLDYHMIAFIFIWTISSYPIYLMFSVFLIFNPNFFYLFFFLGSHINNFVKLHSRHIEFEWETVLLYDSRII